MTREPRAGVSVVKQDVLPLQGHCLAVVLVDFFLEEQDAAGHLGQAFGTVFDGDPARVVDLAQNAKNGIVIVQTFPDLPVTQIGRITQRSVRLSECFEPGVPKQAEMDFVKARRRETAAKP